jgi:alpha-tubulin suppressor-like RCC1 family protein
LQRHVTACVGEGKGAHVLTLTSPSRRCAAAAALAVSVLSGISLDASPAVAATVRGHPAAASTVTLTGWGRNDHGQLADGTTKTPRLRPVTAKLPPGVTITSVRAGCVHTLALTSTGKLLAWGDNSFGELGDDLATESSTTPVTVQLPAGTKITAIRAGCGWSLALTSTGSVLSWGINDLGQLGNGTIGSDTVNLPASVMLPAGVKIKGISAGDATGLAVTTDGHALGWGFNGDGQVGDGTTSTQPAPVQVSLPDGVKVTAVAAGQRHSLALTGQGQVLAWGFNGDGQLGIGNRDGSLVPVTTKLPAGTKVSGLFAGCFHSVALTAAGRVFFWGAGARGQLGNGGTADRATPVQVKMPAGTKVTGVSAGCSHTLALTAAGKVYAWGSGARGQLGNGFSVDHDRPVLAGLPAGRLASAISSGPTSQSSLAITHKASP